MCASNGKRVSLNTGVLLQVKMKPAQYVSALEIVVWSVTSTLEGLKDSPRMGPAGTVHETNWSEGRPGRIASKWREFRRSSYNVSWKYLVKGNQHERSPEVFWKQNKWPIGVKGLERYTEKEKVYNMHHSDRLRISSVNAQIFKENTSANIETSLQIPKLYLIGHDGIKRKRTAICITVGELNSANVRSSKIRRKARRGQTSLRRNIKKASSDPSGSGEHLFLQGR